MALPVAQLGYMPNVGTPSARPSYQVRNPWEDLAMQVLGAVASQGVGNLMQRDYASQSASEQLQKPMVVTPENAGTTVSQPPQNAPWYSKLLQGPQMNAGQYGMTQQRQDKKSEGQVERKSRATENEADRQARQKLQDQQIRQAAEQFGKTHSLRSEELGLQRQTADRDTVLKGAQVDIARQNAATDRMRAEASAGPGAAAERAAAMLNDQYADYLVKYSQQAIASQALGRPLPPPMSLQDFVKQYEQMRAATGLQTFQPSQGQNLNPSNAK